MEISLPPSGTNIPDALSLFHRATVCANGRYLNSAKKDNIFFKIILHETQRKIILPKYLTDRIENTELTAYSSIYLLSLFHPKICLYKTVIFILYPENC